MELLRCYSNNPTYLLDLHMTLKVVAEDEAGEDGPSLGVVRRRPRRGWSTAERLAVDGVQDVVRQYREGVTARWLAEMHAVSLSTIKRLLRASGARRRPRPPG